MSGTAAPAGTSVSSNALPLGTRLDEFEIQGVIGEGGFGIVYLAFDHSLQRTVAVKEYMPGALAVRRDDETVALRGAQYRTAFDAGLRSFIKEARLLASFEHPALLKVYRFWEQHGTGYMAMPYYEGRTLKQRVLEDPNFANENRVKLLLSAIADALDALHRENCYHRDVSPDNIQITKSGAPVLLDFGAARHIISEMTQAVTVILKPGYAPIEQYADDAKQGAWTDVYALSAVTYFAILGKAPPAATNRVLRDPLVPLTTLAPPGYSNAFLAGVDRGLAVRPEARPQTIAEFRELLDLPVYRYSHYRSDAAPQKTIAATEHVAPAVLDDAPAISIDAGQSSAAPSPAPIRPRSATLARSARWMYGIAVALVLAAIVALAWNALEDGARPRATDAVVLAPPNAVAPPADASAGVASAPPVQQPQSAGTVPSSPAPTRDGDAGSGTKRDAIGTPAQRDIALANTGTSAMQPDARSAQPRERARDGLTSAGRVRIPLDVRPWGEVYVDGRRIGRTPGLKELELAPGTYFIEIRHARSRSLTLQFEVARSDAGKYSISHTFE